LGEEFAEIEGLFDQSLLAKLASLDLSAFT